ncbi:MAG: prepilin-type N-terminal cleavage/methylation domain-containing protein [Planctomycetota bacterium]
MNRSPRLSRLTGFTLIELLVVISIIGLLISILLPALGAARHTARLSQDLSQLRQIATANAAYYIDFDGALPAPSYDNSVGTADVTIDELLIPYLQGVSYGFQEAMDRQFIYENLINMEIWQSPVDSEDPPFDGQKRSYAMNRSMTGANAENATTTNAWDARHNRGVARDYVFSDSTYSSYQNDNGFNFRSEDIGEPSNVISYAPQFRDVQFCGWGGSTTSLWEIARSDRGFYGFGWGAGDLNSLYGYKLNGGSGEDPMDYTANFAFGDGHAKGVELEDTQDPNAPGFEVIGRSMWNAWK